MTQAELNEARDLRDLIRNEERRLNAYRLAAQNLVPVLDGMPHPRTCTGKPEKIALLIKERRNTPSFSYGDISREKVSA